MAMDISDAMIDEFLGSVEDSTLEYEFWATIADVFKYQGFDPRVILKILIQREPNLAQFTADMQTLCAWVETRGTKITRTKQVKNTTQAGQEIIRRLQTRYQIRDVIPDSPTIVTMARIVACFPQLIAKIRMATPNVRVIGKVPDGFVSWLCFPGAPALFPDTQVGDALYEMWMQWNISFDLVINAKNHDPVRLRQYGDIVRRSPIIPKDKREEAITKLRRLAEVASKKAVTAPNPNNVVFDNLKRSLSTVAPSTVLDEGVVNVQPTYVGGGSTVQAGSSIFGQTLAQRAASAGPSSSTSQPGSVVGRPF